MTFFPGITTHEAEQDENRAKSRKHELATDEETFSLAGKRQDKDAT